MNDATELSRYEAPSFSLVPRDLKEAMEFAKLISDSDMVPTAYKGKPANVLIATQMGSEIGLAWPTALQSIAVINGRPCIYGDVGKALLLSKGCKIEEDDIEDIKKNGMGRCRISRPGHPPCERTFSRDSAKTAKLWGKQGPWTDYPERQMAWRAFWFAARDCAADILRGMQGAEELNDARITERDMGDAERVEDFRIAQPRARVAPEAPAATHATSESPQQPASTAASQTEQPAQSPEPSVQLITPSAREHLTRKLDAKSLTPRFCEAFDIEKPADLPMVRINEALKWIDEQ